MKRARYLAAALPAAVGLAIPVTAVAATTTSAHGKKVADPTSRNFGIARRSASSCFGGQPPFDVDECLKVQGSGLFVSNANLIDWELNNQGRRCGSIAYFNSGTHVPHPDWRFRCKTQTQNPWSFLFTPNCYLPHSGTLSGTIVNFGADAFVKINGTHHTGDQICSGA